MEERQRTGRGPDAGRTIECKETDADRTRARPFLPAPPAVPASPSPRRRLLRSTLGRRGQQARGGALGPTQTHARRQRAHAERVQNMQKNVLWE
eukprot:gene5305-biopygen2704